MSITATLSIMLWSTTTGSGGSRHATSRHGGSEVSFDGMQGEYGQFYNSDDDMDVDQGPEM